VGTAQAHVAHPRGGWTMPQPRGALATTARKVTAMVTQACSNVSRQVPQTHKKVLMGRT